VITLAWPLQEAKRRFSELVRRAVHEGPQVVTRHGEEAVVVLSAADYERLTRPDFKEFLLSGPDWEGLEPERDTAPARIIEL